MQEILEGIGSFTLRVFEQVGVIAILFGQTLRQLPKIQRRLTLAQMAHLGVNSLPIVSLTLLFAGMIFSCAMAPSRRWAGSCPSPWAVN